MDTRVAARKCVGVAFLGFFLLVAGCDPGSQRRFINPTDEYFAIQYPLPSRVLEPVPPHGERTKGGLIGYQKVGLYSPGKPARLYSGINCDRWNWPYRLPYFEYQLDSVGGLRFLRPGLNGPVKADRNDAFYSTQPEQSAIPELWRQWFWLCNWTGFSPEFEGRPSDRVPGFPESCLAVPGGELVLTAWCPGDSRISAFMTVRRSTAEVAGWFESYLASDGWRRAAYPHRKTFLVGPWNDFKKKRKHLLIRVEGHGSDGSLLAIGYGEE